MDKIALGKVALDAARLLFSDGGAGWIVAFLLGGHELRGRTEVVVRV